MSFVVIAFFLTACNSEKNKMALATNNDYMALTDLFNAWRDFETPPMKDGAPDYTAETFKKRWPEFIKLQNILNAIDTTGWPVPHKVDWNIVRAEMNGFDFNYRVLQPWSRDPAFYKSIWTERSDVPAHEGPTHHKTTELWTYTFPLSASDKTRLLSDLSVIPPLNEQAKQNLTGNAKDLWITGIRDINFQAADLKQMLELPGIENDQDIILSINAAMKSTLELADWLEKQGKSKTGPSGIGKENYTWFLKNVLLVPLTWEDEVMILKNELSRAWTTLKLEEHRNRKLPLLNDADSPESYDELSKSASKSLMTFLDKEEILTVKDYFEPALQPHLGTFVPKEKRNFFWITAHYDPRPLYSHFYHWFELAIMDKEPHKNDIRKKPLLYNIFVSHNEGLATGVEEMFMHAGLYDDNPRVREIVYIMIAQRAARGLGSLYAHANEMTMEEAGKIHSEYTPRGWMKTEKELLIFEQHLYLRQPGYGTSYITGKYLLEDAIKDYAKLAELNNEPFRIKEFLDRLNDLGNIPMTLGHWEITGSNKHMTEILK